MNQPTYATDRDALIGISMALSDAVQATVSAEARQGLNYAAGLICAHLAGTRPVIDEFAGAARLHDWFGLSYASWLIIPRVLMQAMPDDWQGRMAEMMEAWDGTWKGEHPVSGVRAQAIDDRGHFMAMPAWLNNYRHPDEERITAMHRDQHEDKNRGRA